MNWQGDEPFICEKMILDLLQDCDEKGVDAWTLKKRIIHLDELANPHLAKVVCDPKGRALYLSRSPIPYYPDACPMKTKNSINTLAFMPIRQRA